MTDRPDDPRPRGVGGPVTVPLVGEVHVRPPQTGEEVRTHYPPGFWEPESAPERANREGDSQGLPVVNERGFIQDAVIADIEARKELGIRRYGTALQPFNGRDMLLDAYEEALDLAIYLKGALVEREEEVERATTRLTQLLPTIFSGSYAFPREVAQAVLEAARGSRDA